MKPILILLFLAALLCDARASSPIASSYVVQGWNSECFLVMRPSVIRDKFVGIVTCYEIDEDGGFKKRWEIEDKYSFEGRLFLGEQGSVLVRIVEVIQPQPDPDKAQLSKQTVLEFSRKGKSFKEISVKDVTDPLLLEPSGVMSGVLATHQIFKFEEAVTPKMGRLLHFDFFDDEDKETMRKTITDETEIFCIKTIQAELLVFKVSDGSLIYRKKLK